MNKILIVEDEAAIRDLIKIGLETKGYKCDYANDGELAANLIENKLYDLILLDIMLPKIDGYELLEYTKQVVDIPIIFITAKSQTKDIIKGLKNGADDYITKPFETEELIARVEAVLRRYNKINENMKIGDVTINTVARKVKLNNKTIEESTNRNIKENTLEKCYLENSIISNIQIGEEITNEKIIEYIKKLYSYMENEKDMIALYTNNGEKIFSNFEEIDNVNVQELFDTEMDKRCLRKIKDKNYMLLSTCWTINSQIIYIINIYDISYIYQKRDRQLIDILYADIIILAVSSVFVAIFSIILNKPIKVLNETSQKISMGKFSERVDIKSQDEIGELSNSFNIMAEQIENKINSLNLSIKQKNDFITGFTHEIKTPMTAIIGYSDLLRLRKCNKEVTKKALDYIYHESKRLEKLSYKLMSLMSVSEDKIELKNIEIKKFIEKISKKILLEQINLELQVEKAVVKLDEDLLEIVIRNLVENAKKAEPKDKVILIQGKLMGNKYRISIKDKGKGIPKEHIKRVTEDFYMVDKSRSRENGGSGIGLSLCKKILELHNSEINIKSREHIGTTVYFELEVINEK